MTSLLRNRIPSKSIINRQGKKHIMSHRLKLISLKGWQRGKRQILWINQLPSSTSIIYRKHLKMDAINIIMIYSGHTHRDKENREYAILHPMIPPIFFPTLTIKRGKITMDTLPYDHLDYLKYVFTIIPENITTYWEHIHTWKQSTWNDTKKCYIHTQTHTRDIFTKMKSKRDNTQHTSEAKWAKRIFLARATLLVQCMYVLTCLLAFRPHFWLPLLPLPNNNQCQIIQIISSTSFMIYSQNEHQPPPPELNGPVEVSNVTVTFWTFELGRNFFLHLIFELKNHYTLSTHVHISAVRTLFCSRYFFLSGLLWPQISMIHAAHAPGEAADLFTQMAHREATASVTDREKKID